ncbi:hypothetical protein NECID01_0776 [Nematocida sp. AWRm77]|nr:hypothetical protein NECID01_0776 [Nematocida sp. AWRm77]
MQSIKEKEEAVHSLLEQNGTEILKELGEYLESIVSALESSPVHKEGIDALISVEKKIHSLFTVLFEQAKAKEPSIAVFQEIKDTVDAYLNPSPEEVPSQC